MSASSKFAAFVLVGCGAMTSGCNDVSFPDPFRIQTLRVLGVRADPATLVPGESARLTLHCADGINGGGEDPTCNAEVAWFGGCHNPPDNDPDQCFSSYAKWVGEPGRGLAELTQSEAGTDLALGDSYAFVAPEDVLSGSFEVEGQRIRYGISYVFFAACAGHWVARAGSSETLPIECRDRDTGRTLSQDRWVVGRTTLYSYDVVRSRSPKLLATSFDGMVTNLRCNTSADCQAGLECSSDALCVPVVSPCTKGASSGCKPHCVGFSLDHESYQLFTLDGTAIPFQGKSLWLSSYTNAGNVLGDIRVELPAPPLDSKASVGSCVSWQAPPRPTEHAHVWIVFRDNRGGLTVQDQRILVR